MVIASSPVSPLGGPQLAMFLLQVGLLLGLALLLGRLAVRLSLPAIVGELLTGILLGPSLLGHALPDMANWLFPRQPDQFHLLDAIGQVGVILLVGLTGLQLDLQMVRRRATTAVSVSLPGLVIPLGLGVTAGLMLPAMVISSGSNRTVLAVFLGVAMCVSAIPVIAKTLMDLKLLHRNVGQLILIAGTVDDILGWLGLSIVTAMATTGLRAGNLVMSIAYLCLFVVMAALVGRPLTRMTMRAAMRSSESGPVITAAVILMVLLSALTQRLGLEAIFGALVAGMLIRASGTEVLAKLAPLRAFVMAVLAPVFFAIAGLRMDLTALARPTVLLTAVVLLLIAVVGKFAGAFIGAWLSGLNRWEALALGAGMNARGVVEVVVAMVGVRLGVLNTEMYTIIVLIAVVTSLMGPPILRMAMARLEVTADERLRRSEQDVMLPANEGLPVEHA